MNCLESKIGCVTLRSDRGCAQTSRPTSKITKLKTKNLHTHTLRKKELYTLTRVSNQNLYKVSNNLYKVSNNNLYKAALKPLWGNKYLATYAHTLRRNARSRVSQTSTLMAAFKPLSDTEFPAPTAVGCYEGVSRRRGY